MCRFLAAPFDRNELPKDTVLEEEGRIKNYVGNYSSLGRFPGRFSGVKTAGSSVCKLELITVIWGRGNGGSHHVGMGEACFGRQRGKMFSVGFR